MFRRAPVRALLLDDDPGALALLRHELRLACPSLEIEVRGEPDVSGPARDVYVVDNDFSGDSRAGDLLEAVRATAPDALVLAWSARLDAPTLKRLVNAGCDGAFAKQDREETARAVRLVASRARELRRGRRHPGTSVASLLDAVTSLLREWNERLGGEDRALAAPSAERGAGR